MSYIGKLSSTQKTNMGIIIKAFSKWGITNTYTQAGILAIISKESSFKCGFERGYSNTSNDRIRKIFGSRVRRLSEHELTITKSNDVKFFNLVYGGRYGNNANEGFKFRGAGFNQITFKGNYDSAMRRTGVNLIDHPELIEDPDVAADAAITYFIDRFKSGYAGKHKTHYNANGINDFKTLDQATLAIYHANAGFGKPMYSIGRSEVTGGLSKALLRAPEFLASILHEVVFESKADGDKFREWVNDNHTEYASVISLDRSGSHTNAYIMKAWAKFKSEYKK